MNNLLLKTKYLFKISRPRFWMYTFGPALLAVLSQIAQPNHIFDISIVLHLLYFLIPANLLIYGVNDISDQDTDKFNNKKGTYELKHTESYDKFLWFSMILINLPFWLFFIFNLSLAYVFSIVAFLFFSIQYSAKPIRAKAKPIIDGLFNILYVLPAVSSLVLLDSNFDLQTILILLSATLWCMAMHAFSAIPDIEADIKAHLNTTAVFLGRSLTFVYCFVLYFLSAALIVAQGISLLSLLLFIYPLVTAYTFKHTEKTFKIYKFFPYINTFIGFLFAIQIISRFI